MNNKTRIVLGLLSSLLFACGFIRAADHLDPLGHSSALKNVDGIVCTETCDTGGGGSTGTGGGGSGTGGTGGNSELERHSNGN